MPAYTLLDFKTLLGSVKNFLLEQCVFVAKLSDFVLLCFNCFCKFSGGKCASADEFSDVCHFCIVVVSCFFGCNIKRTVCGLGGVIIFIKFKCFGLKNFFCD